MVKINDMGHFIYNDEKYKMLYIYISKVTKHLYMNMMNEVTNISYTKSLHVIQKSQYFKN